MQPAHFDIEVGWGKGCKISLWLFVNGFCDMQISSKGGRMSTDLMDRFEYINFYFLTHSFILKIFGYIARTLDRRRRSRDRLVLFHPISSPPPLSILIGSGRLHRWRRESCASCNIKWYQQEGKTKALLYVCVCVTSVVKRKRERERTKCFETAAGDGSSSGRGCHLNEVQLPSLMMNGWWKATISTLSRSPPPVAGF